MGLTLPYPLRYRCAYDARLTSAVLRAFLRALFAELRRRARQQGSAPRGQCGAVTFIQRFGSALNANLHFHTLALDGVYARTERQPTRFLPLPPPSHYEVTRVLAGTARRITRVLASRAEGDDDVLDRYSFLAGIALLFTLLAPGIALASVKCQCNNGSVVNSMGADYDDEDVDEKCNDACSSQGGGRVWSVDRDQDHATTTTSTTTRGRQQPRQTPQR